MERMKNEGSLLTEIGKVTFRNKIILENGISREKGKRFPNCSFRLTKSNITRPQGSYPKLAGWGLTVGVENGNLDTPKVKPALLFMLKNEVGRGECQTRFAMLLAR